MTIKMIGLDTNILARYYIESDPDDIKTQHQRHIAKQIIESNENLFIAKTVIIEFEWVLRGVYKFSVDKVLMVFEHLLTLSHITIEGEKGLIKAIAFTKQGLEFTDALHLANYEQCKIVYSFDDKGFAKKAVKNHLLPPVIIPQPNHK